MALKRPPEHAADAEPRFIWRDDTAWNHEMIDRERKELAAGERHPVDVYLAGETRFDLDALMTIGGQSVPVTNYLNGTPPTVFHLRRVPSRRASQAARGLSLDIGATLHDLAREGVTKIRDGLDGSAPWVLEGGSPGFLSEHDMQTIFDISSNLVDAIGLAVYQASKSLSESEGKR